MKTRKTIGGLVLALGFAGTATLAAAASSSEEIELQIPPPPERVEVIPAPREGYIYERGHYDWDGDRYVWREGRFIANRDGHVYTPHVLEHRGETWYYRRGNTGTMTKVDDTHAAFAAAITSDRAGSNPPFFCLAVEALRRGTSERRRICAPAHVARWQRLA